MSVVDEQSQAPRACPAEHQHHGEARLAAAAAGLGGVGLLLSVVLIGAVPAAAGLAVAGWYLFRRRASRGLAWVGWWLSSAALVASAGFALAFLEGVHPLQFLMTTVSDTATRNDPVRDWEGRPAPEIEFTSRDGTRFRLSELRGRRVILDFWATWCPPCVREIPHFQQLSDESSPTDLLVVGVTSENDSVLGPFVAAHRMRYPVVSADLSAWPEPFSLVTALPTTFFLDRTGVIRRVAVGYHDLAALRAFAAALEDPSHEPNGKLRPEP